MKLFERLEEICKKRRMDVAAIEHTMQVLMREELERGQKLIGGKVQKAITIRAISSGSVESNGNGNGKAHTPTKATPTWERVRDYLATVRGHRAKVGDVWRALAVSYTSVDSVGRTHGDVFKRGPGWIALRKRGAAPKSAPATKSKKRYSPAAKKKFKSVAAKRWKEARDLGFTRLPSIAALTEARARAAQTAAESTT